ncbi:MAG: hypothetical protein RI560_06770, partial [Natronomonas sp.]|nr:hypothetical protein [Natronomonas sp.]
MSARKQTAAEERIVNELDAILPGEIDRRKFLNGAIGTMGAIMLAGCTGGGNGDDGGSGSPEDTEAIFTTPWKIEPSWGHAHVAEG